MKKNALTSVLLLLIAWALNAESPAQVYKYVDKKGGAHFTNVPADPRYKPASRNINRKAPKRYKHSKSIRHSESAPSKNIRQVK